MAREHLTPEYLRGLVPVGYEARDEVTVSLEARKAKDAHFGWNGHRMVLALLSSWDGQGACIIIRGWKKKEYDWNEIVKAVLAKEIFIFDPYTLKPISLAVTIRRIRYIPPVGRPNEEFRREKLR